MTASSPSRHCADELDVRLRGQQRCQPLARERFVVDDQRLDFLHDCVPQVDRWRADRASGTLPRDDRSGCHVVAARGVESVARAARELTIVRVHLGHVQPQGERRDDREPRMLAMELEAEVGAEEVLQPGARRRHADALLQRTSARPRTGPTPSSRTSSQSLSPSRRAVMSMWPGPDFRATPCLIAFSTSGCSSRVGTSASSVSGWTSKWTTSRSANRVCSISRYFARKSSSAWSGDLLLADVLERHPQQIAEAHQRPVGGLDVAVHQRRDRVQGVEQEMGMQLLLQRRQLRLDELRLELGGAHLALARLAVVEHRVAEAGDGPVGHHFPVEVLERRPLAPASTRQNDRPSVIASHHWTPLMAAMWANEKIATAGRWTSDGPPEALPLEPEVLRQPDDRRREERPQIPVGAVEEDERRPAGDRPAEGEGELPGQRRGE